MIRASSLAVVAAALCCASCQFDGYRPDVRFGEDNDRFNIDAVMRSVQTRPQRPPSDSELESRRNLDDITTRLLLNHLRRNARRRSWRRNDDPEPKPLPNARRILFEDLFPGRRQVTNNLLDVEDVQGSDRDEQVFKKPKSAAAQQKMQQFVDMLHDEPPAPPTRRLAAGDAERDVLLHYGFPFHVKIKGFLGPRIKRM